MLSLTLPNTTNFVIATPVHQENTVVPTNILPLGTMVYVGSFTDFKYVPVIILYDPPGRESYQQVTEETTTNFRVDIESNEFGLYAGGAFTGSQSIKREYSSSKNTTDPNDIGPGKGDTIVCRYFQLTFDVYRVYESPGPLYVTSTELPSPNSYRVYDYVQLRSARAIGTGLLSRRTLEYKYLTIVENRTNTTGKYAEHVEVDSSREYTIEVTTSVTSGVSFGVDVESETGIPLVPKVKLRFIITFTTSYEYTVLVRFYDPSNRIVTWMNANVQFQEYSGDYFVNDWTFWFNTTW